MADRTFEKQLALTRAKASKEERTGLDNDESLVLRWDMQTSGLVEDACDWLEANRRYINNAEIEGRTYDGYYRSISVEREGTVIVQTFAKGWITSLVTGSTLDWTEARLVSNTELPAGSTVETPIGSDVWGNPEQYLLFRWTGIDPEKAEEVSDAINQLTADGFDPVVNGETYGTGDYTRLYCRPFVSFDSTDRSATIDLLVAKPRFNLKCWDSYNTVAQVSRYELYNVPKYIAQELINSYNQEVGATANPSPPDDDGLLTITIEIPSVDGSGETVITSKSCTEKITTTYYLNQASPTEPPASSSGVWYDSRWQQQFNSGLWSGSIEKHELLTVVVETFTSISNSDILVTKKEWLNLRDDGAGGYEDDEGSAVVLPDMTKVTGYEKSLRKQKGRYCTTNVEYSEAQALDQIDTSTTVSHTSSETRESHSNNAAPLGPAVPAPGEARSNLNRKTRSGNTATQEVIKVGVGVLTTITYPNGDYITIGRNQAAGVLQALVNGVVGSAQLSTSGETPAEYKDLFNWSFSVKYKPWWFLGSDDDPVDWAWPWKNEKGEPFITRRRWTADKDKATEFMSNSEEAVGSDMSFSGRMWSCTLIEKNP